MTLSAALIRVYASGGPADFYYETLSLWHPNFTAAWNITNNPRGFTARLEDGVTYMAFQPYPFKAQMAGTGEDGNQDVEITISNVDRRPIDEIERAAESPTVQIQMVFRKYVANDLNNPGEVVDGLSISSVIISEDHIVARASASDLLNRVFPSRVYTTAMFPGLYHV